MTSGIDGATDLATIAALLAKLEQNCQMNEELLAKQQSSVKSEGEIVLRNVESVSRIAEQTNRLHSKFNARIGIHQFQGNAEIQWLKSFEFLSISDLSKVVSVSRAFRNLGGRVALWEQASRDYLRDHKPMLYASLIGSHTPQWRIHAKLVRKSSAIEHSLVRTQVRQEKNKEEIEINKMVMGAILIPSALNKLDEAIIARSVAAYMEANPGVSAEAARKIILETLSNSSTSIDYDFYL